MVNDFLDNADPHWAHDEWEALCVSNPENRSLRCGQRVYLNYRDPDRFKNQQSVAIVDFRVVGTEWWADLSGRPNAAPRWALVAAG